MCDRRNQFCYVCGLFVDKKHRLEFKKNQTVVEAFNLLFNRSYVESAWYEPEYVCSMCATTIRQCKSGKFENKRLPFLTPMVWHRQIYHKLEDCYFCQTNIVGHQYKTRHRIQYGNVLTVSNPTPRESQDTPATTKKLENSPEFSYNESPSEINDKPYIHTGTIPTERHLVSNKDYNDLVRDLGLSLRQSEILASRLKQWNIVENDFKVTSARDRNLTSFELIFKVDDTAKQLVYCVDVDELFVSFNHKHCPNDWRLFLDGSCKSKYFIGRTC